MKKCNPKEQYQFEIKICASPYAIEAYKVHHPSYSQLELKRTVHQIISQIPDMYMKPSINPYCYWYATNTRSVQLADLTNQLLYSSQHPEIRLMLTSILKIVGPQSYDLVQEARQDEQELLTSGQATEEEIAFCKEYPLITQDDAFFELTQIEYV